MKQTTPIATDLVLLGGGHSHAIALRLFGMHPLPGVRLTLITEASDTAYSGMLPGHVAGYYSHEECHIDLRRLAQFAGAQFYLARAIGLDLEHNRVLCANRPPVGFDWLSIDIGSTPKIPAGLDDRSGIAAKPVAQFLEQWQQLVTAVEQQPQRPVTIAIVGGGAGGVELALTMQHRLHQVLHQASQPATNLTLHLLQRDAELLPRHSPWVRQRCQQILTQRQIQIHVQESVQTVQAGKIHCQSGLTLEHDYLIWVTQATAPPWLAAAGLQVDRDGFILVNDELRSLSHPHIFAAGDIATQINHPRPKAGVFAVRQGRPLFENLCRSLQQQPLKPFHPQRHYLSLIGTATGSAIGTWGPLGWESPWLWQAKDRIDRAFMQRFSHLPEMNQGSGRQRGSGIEVREDRSSRGESLVTPMPCSGCGAKVGSTILDRTLQRIHQDFPSPHLPTSPPSREDAAIIPVPPGLALIQTIDYFPALLDDPFLCGQINANHALSDLFAMGAQPHSALALATIPYGAPAQVEETLYQLLSGAVRGLHQAQASLVGGHTIAGEALGFGLSCNGFAPPDRLLRKGGMQPGQALILTKAIGTGTLFAAQMRLQAKSQWIDGAIASMLLSNQAAVSCWLEHGATACTDITGFGLVGHLLEMVRASQVSVALELESIPWLQGSVETVTSGIVSSLQPQNQQAAQAIDNLSQVHTCPQFPLLFDPQTSGGLLAAVPLDRAESCLAKLKTLGYPASAIVGHTLTPGNRITILR
jgi:selenide, water dikinase